MDLTANAGLGQVTIRPARIEDYDAIVHVWNQAGSEVSTQGRESRDAFCKQLLVFPDLYLVAADNETVIGVVFGTHDHRKGWINRLAVLPDYQRRGIARKLAEVCDEAIRSEGIEIVAALIEPDNHASIALFEKIGYCADVPARYFRKRSHPDV